MVGSAGVSRFKISKGCNSGVFVHTSSLTPRPGKDVGFNGIEVGESHKAEIGYWLAKAFWGRGIMTAVVQRVCQHAFQEFGLVKIIAHVVTHNPASARVLEKCGFAQESVRRQVAELEA